MAILLKLWRGSLLMVMVVLHVTAVAGRAVMEGNAAVVKEVAANESSRDLLSEELDTSLHSRRRRANCHFCSTIRRDELEAGGTFTISNEENVAELNKSTATPALRNR